MRVFTYKRLREFWECHPDAKQPLLAWYKDAGNADWDTPAAVKSRYPNASVIKNNRVVFNIKGNDYRMVAQINYPYRSMYIRFLGTHAEYDRVDAEEV